MKYVRKITPVSSADGEGLESWLEDMALQGLYLKKFRPLFCTFTPGPAKKTRYRLEPYRLRLDDDLPRSMLELYQDFGWDYKMCIRDRARITPPTTATTLYSLPPRVKVPALA